MSTSQQQTTKKQMVLNNFIDKLMQLKQNKKMKVPLSNVFGMQKVQLNFMEMFDLFLWMEKKRPQILQNALEMDVLSLAIKLIPIDQMSSEIKAFILLINNCKINGEIIIYLLANGLIDLIIVKYLRSISNVSSKQYIDLDQKLEYLGSLLKACNIHMNQKTYVYFLNKKVYFDEQERIKQKQKSHSKIMQQNFCDPDDIFNTCDVSLQKHSDIQSKEDIKECLLLKVCSRFYNCPEQLTKTTVLNILMGILRQPYTKQLIIDKSTNKIFSFLKQWSRNLCCQFRNQLKNFNQQLMVIKTNQQDFFIQQINDKIILWEDLTHSQLKDIYRQNFLHMVIYSLIIGSLNTLSLPMFNIKFTFFILAKMMKICSNLDLVKVLGNLLFVKNNVSYSESWVSTAVLKGFDIDRILDDNYYQTENKDQEQINEFSGINDFFLNMLKSKDQHFLQISSNMLQQMLLYVKKDNQLVGFFNQKLGFGPTGRSLITMSSILIGQLKFDHSLTNLKRVCQTLIYIQPNKQLNEQNTNQFVYFYSDYLSETLDTLQKGSKHWNYIVQTFQYDMKILQLIKFMPKSLKDKQLLIHPSEREEQQIQVKEKEKSQMHQKIFRKSFYDSIPQTPSQILRYRIVKTFLLLKFKEVILQTKENDQILSKYVEKLKSWQLKQSKPGDKIPYPLKQKFHQCKVIQQKTQIPCVVIQDDVNLIVGFVESNFVKIIINVKIKHIQTEIYTKKDKTYLKLNVSKFDFGLQNIVHKSTILIRGFQTGIQYLAVKRQNFKQKELSSIRKGLKKTVQNLPEISLL